MKIRPALPTDGKAIGQLIFDTVRSVNIKDYSPAQIETWVPDPSTYCLFDGIPFVVEKNGVILGFANLLPEGLIHRLYVHKDYQGQGVGKKLLEEIEKEAKKLGHSRIFTESSITAKAFFEKNGFLVEREQVKTLRSVNFVNYLMIKELF